MSSSTSNKRTEIEMPRTRAASLYSCTALFFLIPALTQAQSPTLEIRMPELKFDAGAQIRVDVIVKNSSAEKLHVWKASAQADGLAEAYVSVVVRDSQGKSASRIDGPTIVSNGKKYVLPKRWLTRKGAYVEPHQELHDYLLLNELFDLTGPGTYTVSVRADFEAPDSGPEIKWLSAESNSIRFVVTKGSR